MKKKPQVLTMRYEGGSNRRGAWCVTLMNGPQAGLYASGVRGEEPEWLQRILLVAKVGGHEMPIPRPPPETIVWFRVNTEHELVEFMPT
jgi:hypothetical protein